MTSLPPGYDAWRLSTPDDESDGIGVEDGQPCNRIHPPDEDAPRGYRPRRCKGEMESVTDGCGEHWIECDTCGEIA